ncbi:MAG: hypothetical protein RR182_00145 [Alistipes sp.]
MEGDYYERRNNRLKEARNYEIENLVGSVSAFLLLGLILPFLIQVVGGFSTTTAIIAAIIIPAINSILATLTVKYWKRVQHYRLELYMLNNNYIPEYTIDGKYI